MARLNVNPTRMELTKLKKRLATSTRGHKLLKDKQDELMRRFIDLVKYNNVLRKEVEEMLGGAFKDFVMARAVMSSEFLEEAIAYPKESISLEVAVKNIMSVNVPVMEFKRSMEDDAGSIYPYGFGKMCIRDRYSGIAQGKAAAAGIAILAKNPEHTTKAVSYTHLDTKPPQDRQQNKSYIGNIIEYSPNPSEPSFFDNIIEKTNLNNPIVILEMESTIVSL